MEHLKACVIAQEVSRGLFIAEARVRSLAILCWMCTGQNATSVFPCQYPSTNVSITPPMSVSLHQCQYHSTNVSVTSMSVSFHQCQYHSTNVSIPPPMSVSLHQCAVSIRHFTDGGVESWKFRSSINNTRRGIYEW
jgi:hypothetical protein